MAVFSAYLGKGLNEPCSPYRSTYVFGAAANTPNADGWNCLPTIAGSTANFDLTGLSPLEEVCVALANLSSCLAGTYSICFRFYFDTPRRLLFTYTYSRTVVAGARLYSYAYIGWWPSEISENGAYFVEITVSGRETFSRTINFIVTGIPAPPPPPPPPPPPGAGIVETLNSVSAFFYAIYLTTLGWVWPFWYVAELFYELSRLFSSLAWLFSDFITLVNSLVSKIAAILSWDSIRGLILGWLPQLENSVSWFLGWVNNVTSVITNWWSATQTTVKGWITTAVQGLAGLLVAWDNFAKVTWPGWVNSFNSLKAAWDNFWAVTLPTLVDFGWLSTWWNSRLTDIQGLINSAFTARKSLWEGWQDMRNQVVEFFTNPVEYIWDRFADWFLGPEG